MAKGDSRDFLIRLKNDVRDILRNSAKVLNSLNRHDKDLNYKYERLYRILFNTEMYAVAYQRIAPKHGNMTEGTDGKTIDGMSIKRIEDLIASLKDESYQPQPSRRTYIPKKNEKMRPLGIPATEDKLLQEVVKMVLEAIYEESFEYTSHGFRPTWSCHTALKQIEKSFCGVKWYIEDDIKGFFDNINHDVMIKILEERIKDVRFIRLIRKFLNVGYIEDWEYFHTHNGIPQRGIISPVLANIYLDKLDKYMTEYAMKFDRNARKEMNPQYRHYQRKKKRAKKALKTAASLEERKLLVEQLREYDNLILQTPAKNDMDCNFKRLKYVRYADDFLCGVIDSKEDAMTIKLDIKQFISDKLKLELSDEKTLITHSETLAKFLGFHIRNRKCMETKGILLVVKRKVGTRRWKLKSLKIRSRRNFLHMTLWK